MRVGKHSPRLQPLGELGVDRYVFPGCRQTEHPCLLPFLPGAPATCRGWAFRPKPSWFSQVVKMTSLPEASSVVYFSEFDGDRANRENGQAKPEIKWGIIANEIQRGHQYKSEKRPEC